MGVVGALFAVLMVHLYRGAFPKPEISVPMPVSPPTP